MNKLCLTNTFYKYKHHKLVTWTSTDGRAQNQIDFIIIQESCKSTVKNCWVFNSADIGSDHSLLMSTCLSSVKKRKQKSTSRKFNVEQLENKVIPKKLEIKLDKMFEPLLNLETSANDLGTLQGRDKYYNKGGC